MSLLQLEISQSPSFQACHVWPYIGLN